MLKKKKSTNADVNEVVDAAKRPPRKVIRFDKSTLMVSTGCTLLDLAICGGRIRGGGLPGGILVEISGPSSSGKTAVLVEIGANAASRGGMVRYQDPEARLDREVSKIYDLTIDNKDYYRPDTVNEMVENLLFDYPSDKVINVDCVDSLAALSTELELGEKGDKMGMKRAKDFSAGMRKLARVLAKSNRLVLCSNQERQGDYGTTTPGGLAVPYYASLRIRVYKKEEMKRTTTLKSGAKVTKVVGIYSECYIKKSSLDDPFRTAPLYITFGVGIDDIRGNLQWLKDMKKDNQYVIGENEFKSMEHAISYVEKNNLESTIREEVIDLWETIEARFKVDRKPKVRF